MGEKTYQSSVELRIVVLNEQNLLVSSILFLPSHSKMFSVFYKLFGFFLYFSCKTLQAVVLR